MEPTSAWYDDTNAAKRYAALAQGNRFPFYRLFAQQNIDFISPVPDGLIVDGFAGTGIVAQLLRESGNNNDIVLVDKSPAMLDEAKRFVESFNTSFIAGDMLRIDHIAPEASAIIASQGVHRIPEVDGGVPSLLEAVYRALRRGGVFSFNLDGTSIAISGVPQLYEFEPYKIFFREILPAATGLQSGRAEYILHQLACQFSRFSIDRILRFVRCSPFGEAEYEVHRLNWSRALLEQVHFVDGTPQMINLQDPESTMSRALSLLHTYENYNKSWRGRNELPFYSVNFRLHKPLK